MFQHSQIIVIHHINKMKGPRWAGLRAPWEGWGSQGWEWGAMPGLKGAESGWRGSGPASRGRGGWWGRTEPMRGCSKGLRSEASRLELRRDGAGANFGELVEPGGWGGIERAGAPAMGSWQGHKKREGRKVEGLRGGRKTKRPSCHQLHLLPGSLFPFHLWRPSSALGRKILQSLCQVTQMFLFHHMMKIRDLNLSEKLERHHLSPLERQVLQQSLHMDYINGRAGAILKCSPDPHARGSPRLCCGSNGSWYGLFHVSRILGKT